MNDTTRTQLELGLARLEKRIEELLTSNESLQGREPSIASAS